MAVILVKDIKNRLRPINEDMTFKRALSRGLFMHLHSRVGNILNMSNISRSQNIEASICKLCKTIRTCT